MENYKAMYFRLAGKVADAVDLLMKAQQEGEDAYLLIEDDNGREDEKDA